MAAACLRLTRPLTSLCTSALTCRSSLVGGQINSHSRSFCLSSKLSAERKFSKKHEWITLEGNVGTVGISNFAQDALGDVVYADLPDAGQKFEQDEECGALESVKAASEIYIPVGGVITAKNEQLQEKPGLINTSCYDQGWLFKVELTDMDQVNGLMSEQEYKEFTTKE